MSNQDPCYLTPLKEHMMKGFFLQDKRKMFATVAIGAFLLFSQTAFSSAILEGQRMNPVQGKEGMIRNLLQGKRVNYSARTVLGPDPNLKFEKTC